MRKFTLIILFSVISIFSFSQAVSVIDKEKLFDFYQNQRYGEAAQYLQDIYGEGGNDLKILTQIGYCFLMAGNNMEAEKFYTRAYKLQPQNLPVLFSLGTINTRRGNLEKARIYYGEIAKIDSNNFSVFKLLANLYANPKDSLKMIYLQKANKINPIESDVAGDLAYAYNLNQDFEKAYQTLDIAIAADSNNLVLQKAKLPIANQLKKYNEVISSGEKLLKDGSDSGVLKDVAKAYYNTKKYQKAIDLFKLLELVAMQNEATLYYTALSYRELKNCAMAISYAKKTIDEAISPNTSSYYGLLGLIHEENSQLGLATTSYKKGLTFKSNPTLYYRLAILNDTKLKNGKTALTFYNLYLKSRPNKESDKDEIKFAKDRIAQLNLMD